jgi:hypothetical protein
MTIRERLRRFRADYGFARDMVIYTPADEIDKRIDIFRKSIPKQYNNITNTD